MKTNKKGDAGDIILFLFVMVVLGVSIYTLAWYDPLKSNGERFCYPYIMNSIPHHVSGSELYVVECSNGFHNATYIDSDCAYKDRYGFCKKGMMFRETEIVADNNKVNKNNETATLIINNVSLPKGYLFNNTCKSNSNYERNIYYMISDQLECSHSVMITRNDSGFCHGRRSCYITLPRGEVVFDELINYSLVNINESGIKIVERD